MRISVEEIEQVFHRLIERIKQDKIEFIDIETDYYWIVMSCDWNNFTSDYPEIAVGSLTDDWDSLQKLLRNECITTYLDYERFASILRAISETIAP